ncbi:MAG: hypothetical protein ACRCS8_05910 [Brevinema sp.]
MKKFLLMVLFIPIFSHTYQKREAMEIWTSFETQHGGMQETYLGLMGGSLSLGVYGFTIGAAMHGTYILHDQLTAGSKTLFNMIYGGAIIGYASPKFVDMIGFRVNLLLGYGTLSQDHQQSGHFVASPTFYIDFYLYGEFSVSAGVTYRYFHDTNPIYGMREADNVFAGVVAITWNN